MYRAECSFCGGMTLVQDGKFQCCLRPVPPAEHTADKKRMTTTAKHRKNSEFSTATKRRVLLAQGNRCAYCKQPFDEPRYDERQQCFIKPRIHWDHFIPFAYAGTGGQENAVAACAKCNRVKSDKVFVTLDEARVVILQSRGLL